MHAWHNLIVTSVFFEKYCNDDEFGNFKISRKKKLLQKEHKEYAEALVRNDMLNEVDINECFNVDNDVPINGQLTDVEILDKDLHPVTMMKKMVKLKMKGKKYPM